MLTGTRCSGFCYLSCLNGDQCRNEITSPEFLSPINFPVELKACLTAVTLLAVLWTSSQAPSPGHVLLSEPWFLKNQFY